MTITPALCTALFLSLLASYQANASSSDWVSGQGGEVRLLTSGGPDETGTIRGALQIELKPGWKTYWADPGDAGVPPSVDVGPSRNIASATVQFPAPRRFDDGFAKWAGYDRSVTLPISFKLLDPKQPATIEAKVFLGICETICVPFQADLAVDPASDPDNQRDSAVVEAAVADLPGMARPDFRAELLDATQTSMRVKVHHAGDASATDFFIAGSSGYQFGPPERQIAGETLIFVVPVLQFPATRPDVGELAYTLTSPEGAVSGTLPCPAMP